MARKRKKHMLSEDQFVNQHFEELQRRSATEGEKITRDYSPHPEGKISDRISFLIQPILEKEGSSRSDYAKTVIGFACMAWNASLLTITERQKTIDDLFNALVSIANDPMGRVLIQNLIHDLIARKLKHFPNDRRFITSYKAAVINGRLQLSVASVDMDEPT
jgi:hypothetical protein